MDKYLIINADDFGLAPGVNKGIIDAFRAGTVSSASMMVNMPGFKDAVQLARKNPNLDIGLHFNLTYGRPISAPLSVPSLVEGTTRFSGNTQSWTAEDIAKELDAQWAKITDAGIQPTHLNSHHHIQRFKTVHSLMTSLATSREIPIRRLSPPNSTSTGLTSDFLISDVYFGEDGLKRLLNNVKTLKPGVTELLCHPGYVDDILLRTSSWTYVREQELRVFLDPRVKRALNQYLTLINYRQWRDMRQRISRNIIMTNQPHKPCP